MIKIEKKLVAYDSITHEPLNPAYLWMDEEDIREYLKQHPMPKDPEYSEEDLIYDLTNSTGMYTLPENVKSETIEYIENLLNDLL